ncbi:MAG: RNA methyltransferase [Cocleimonas sp.]
MKNTNPITDNSLNNIKIVLIKTSHPGNIGSVARAMKVMGLSKLYLVNPKSFPDEQATALSSNARDVLDNATVVNSLELAIADCQLVIGTSARQNRSLKWQLQDSRSCGMSVAKHAYNGKVAIIFGTESSGLSNEELSHCHRLVYIPTNPDYSSLNIASAVQIISYECRLASQSLSKNNDTKPVQDDIAPKESKDTLVNSAAMDSYFEQLESILIETEFLDPEKPRYLMPKLRRLYSRTGVTRSELNILRGILSALQKKNP